VEKAVFCSAIRGHENYNEMKECLGRVGKESLEGEKEKESISEVVTRIENAECEFIEWLDILDFFSKRGTVIELVRKRHLDKTMKDYAKYIDFTYGQGLGPRL